MQMARHGRPEELITDNGPQYTSAEFGKFTKEWEFLHITTSPYHSQANGKIESAVKIAKKILKKTKRGGGDVWKAILDWRNTPTEGIGSSPVQRLMSRRTRTMLPTSLPLLKPKVIEEVDSKIKKRHQLSKKFYDQGTKELPKLKIGENIRMHPLPGRRDQIWQPGQCLEQVGPRSYIVDVNGTLYRRNRKYLRTTNEAPKLAETQEPAEEPAEPAEMPTPEIVPPLVPTTDPNTQPAAIAIGVGQETPTRRFTRTRVVKTPGRFKDFQM
jgi:hypothetical protein